MRTQLRTPLFVAATLILVGSGTAYARILRTPWVLNASDYDNSLATGGQHSCKLRGDGSALCWGSDSMGQSSAPGGEFRHVAAGGSHTCALEPDLGATCWGWDGYGQASPPSNSFVQLSAGFGHTCGLTPTRTVSCWGADFYGQATPPVDLP